jgi:hypothetical protein
MFDKLINRSIQQFLCVSSQRFRQSHYHDTRARSRAIFKTIFLEMVTSRWLEIGVIKQGMLDVPIDI